MEAHVQLWDGGLLTLINSEVSLPAILGLTEQGIRRLSGMLPTYPL